MDLHFHSINFGQEYLFEQLSFLTHCTLSRLHTKKRSKLYFLNTDYVITDLP